MRLISPFRRALMTAGLSLCLIAAAQAAQLTAGKDYTLVRPPQPTDSGSKVEVLEFFWYGCPHCFDFDPEIMAWEKRQAKDCG